MKPSKSVVTGWVLSGILGVFLCVLSASGKFIDFPNKEEMFAKIGWSIETMFYIGIVEVAITILFLIPRTAFIGAILVTAYLGGAIATHVRVNENFAMPIIMGVVLWIALGLRDPRIFRLAFGGKRFDGKE
jgi:uncharacterized membrane protein YphA (DoxX/SURF4 family)